MVVTHTCHGDRQQHDQRQLVPDPFADVPKEPRVQRPEHSHERYTRHWDGK